MALSGCGGGGSGGNAPAVQPTTVIVMMATSGTLPAGRTISGIDTQLNYPVSKGLSISSSNVVASGVGINSLVTANTTTNGQVRIALGNGSGIQTGEFATLIFSITPGFPPVTSADFTIAPGANIVDLSGTIPGISVVIQSPVVIQ